MNSSGLWYDAGKFRAYSKLPAKRSSKNSSGLWYDAGRLVGLRHTPKLPAKKSIMNSSGLW